IRYVAAELTRQKAGAYALFGKTNKAVATALTAAVMFEDEAELDMGHGCELLAGKILLGNQKWLEATTLFTTIADYVVIQPQQRHVSLLVPSNALQGRVEQQESQLVKQQAERIQVETPLTTEHEFTAEHFFDD